MNKILLSIFSLLCCSAIWSGQNIIINKSGTVEVDNILMQLRHFDAQWILTVQDKATIEYLKALPVMQNGLFEGNAKWKLHNGNYFDLHQKIKNNNDSAFQYSVSLKSSKSNPTKALCLALLLPSRVYAGKEISFGYEKYTLPSSLKKRFLISRGKVKELIIHGGKRPLSIKGKNLYVFIQDNRHSGRKEFELRIMCEPGKGDISHANLELYVSRLAPGSAPTSVDNIKVDNKGIVEFDNISLSLKHYDNGWKFSSQGNRGFNITSRKINGGNINIRAKWQMAVQDSAFDVTENVQKDGPGKWNYDVTLKSAAGVMTNTVCAAISIPADIFSGQTILIDGKELKLPVKYEKMTLLRKRNVKKIILYTNSKGMLFEGDLDILLQDNRKFKSNAFELRLMFSPSKGKITASRIEFSMESVSFKSEPVSIRKQANMGFRDEKAGDQKGGWTDQGAENDLRMMKPGTRNIGGVTFDIIDPASNSGKSCMVFSNKDRDYFLNSAVIEPNTKMNKYLYLLHALAWGPRDKTAIGKILVEYADGEHSTISVVNKRDAGNWWKPLALENGILAWTGENRKADVGLFLSKFSLKGKKISKISFSPDKNAVWMVVGLSVSNANIPINNIQPPHYITAGKNWEKIADHDMKIIPDSPLDFSFLLDAPAGKYGHVLIRNGHFEFKNKEGEKIRFYGNNLCFTAQYLDKQACEKLAAQFAAIGYNSVRFHHYDNNLIDHKAKSSTIFDEKMMDKLDYLFHCFKKKGIYITTDLYCSRRFKAGELKGFGKLTHYEMKALIPINNDAFNNWKEFSRKLLTHKNPYTGMSWAEDPALFGISVVNEDTIYNVWKQYPAIKEAYLKKFDMFLKYKKIKCENEQERSCALSAFLIDLQIKSFQRMKDFLRNELKVKALLSDANFTNPVLLSFLREKLDYVDNHSYWDHPAFIRRQWSLPHRYKNINAIKRFAEVPRKMMPTRIIGKPFMVTEFNYCFPNKFRAEGGVLMGAYAALQDWDGLYRFAYSHNKNSILFETRITGFDLVSDPLNMLSEKLGILLFLRGDVTPADKIYPYVFGEKSFKKARNMDGLDGGSFPDDYSRIGLFARIGTISSSLSAKYPDKYDDERKITIPEISNNSIKSSTGQLNIDRDKVVFSAKTPNSEIFITSSANELSGNSVEVVNNGGFSVVGISSMDGKNLTQSGKLLLFHLTDIQNDKIKFMSAREKILLEWGTLPLLMRRGKALVRFKHAKFNKVKVWALSFNGHRLSEVPAEVSGNEIIIKCSTHDYKTMIYEIIIE